MNAKGLRNVYCIFHSQEELQLSLRIARQQCGDSDFTFLSFDDMLFQQLPGRDKISSRSCFMIGDDPYSRLRIPLINQLASTYPMIPSLLIANQPDLVTDFARSNSATCVYRPFTEEQLQKQIKRVLVMSDQRSQLITKSQLVDNLSPREREIAELATGGVPNKSIAQQLDISIKTVEKNRRAAYEKLTVSSAAELASLITFYTFFDQELQH